MKIAIRTDAGSTLDPRNAEALAAPTLDALQREMEVQLAAEPTASNTHARLQAILDRLREQSRLFF
jgi:hypothetical protein